MTDETWPHTLPADSPARASLTQPIDWNAACARTQARHGCDIGEAGRLIVACVGGVSDSTAGNAPHVAQEGSADDFRCDDASGDRGLVSGDPERFHEVTWAEEV